MPPRPLDRLHEPIAPLAVNDAEALGWNARR